MVGSRRWCAHKFQRETLRGRPGQGVFSPSFLRKMLLRCDIVVDQKLLQPVPSLHGQDGRQRVELQTAVRLGSCTRTPEATLTLVSTVGRQGVTPTRNGAAPPPSPGQEPHDFASNRSVPRTT
jgi:hypothetical protein